jgi:hypothetical protein
MMREQSGDALLFQRAKAKRQAALAELERLEWPEQHQRELEAQAALHPRLDQLGHGAEEKRDHRRPHAMVSMTSVGRSSLAPLVDTLIVQDLAA